MESLSADPTSVDSYLFIGGISLDDGLSEILYKLHTKIHARISLHSIQLLRAECIGGAWDIATVSIDESIMIGDEDESSSVNGQSPAVIIIDISIIGVSSSHLLFFSIIIQPLAQRFELLVDGSILLIFGSIIYFCLVGVGRSGSDYQVGDHVGCEQVSHIGNLETIAWWNIRFDVVYFYWWDCCCYIIFAAPHRVTHIGRPGQMGWKTIIWYLILICAYFINYFTTYISQIAFCLWERCTFSTHFSYGQWTDICWDQCLQIIDGDFEIFQILGY